MDKDKDESDSDSSASSGSESRSTDGNSGFRWMKGRRYAEGTPYVLPQDEAETDRLNMQDRIWTALFEGLYLSPMKAQLGQGCRVVDIGCGPGSWLLKMAAAYPKSQFVGLDIVKSIPDSSMLPNVTFIQMNTGEGFPNIEDNSFDFVFQRLMAVSYTKEQWPFLVKELYRICKPEGYVELSESDWKIHKSGPHNHNLNERIMSALSARGLYPRVALKLENMLKEVNFEEVIATYRSVPFGWDNDLGMLVGENFRQGADSSKGWLAPVCDMSQEELMVMVERCLQECANMKQSYLNHFKAWARKPPL